MTFKILLSSTLAIVWRTIKTILFSFYLLFITTFLLFSLLEFFPDLVKAVSLQNIRYYAQASEYVADPTLVFVPRHANKVVDAIEFRGDGYSPGFGIEVSPISYHASYTNNGFRANSSQPPFDLVVVGDSYIEFGESDDSTLSELLKHESGLSTLNLGRGWYGPPQYLEVFKRYGLGTKAQYAILAFFSGNDAEDTRQYIRWQRGGEGGDYYSFVVGRRNFFIRYLHAFRDTFMAIIHWRKESPKMDTTEGAISNTVHPDVGMIQLGGHLVPMYFNYWNQHATSTQLLEREEWKHIRTVIGQFKALAAQNMIIPIIVFIPTKLEVYGSLFDHQSGSRFLSRIHEQLQFDMNTSDALEAVSQEQSVQMVNLMPVFRALARQGKVLYYPFDTHWNVTGRTAAAEVLAKGIQKVTLYSGASHSPLVAASP